MRTIGNIFKLRSYLKLFVSYFFTMSGSLNATPLDFHSALEQLQSRSTAVQAQQAELKKVRAAHLNNIGSFLPTLSAQASDTQTTHYPISRGITRFSQSQTGVLSAQINLFRSFGDLEAWRSGNEAITREQARLEQTVLDAEQTHVQLLLRYLQAEMTHRVTKNILQLDQELADIQNARYRRGLVPLQEFQKAEIEKSNSSAKWQDAFNELSSARAELKSELGFSDQGDLDLGPSELSKSELVKTDWPWKSALNPESLTYFFKKKFYINDNPKWQTANASVEVERLSRRARFRDFLPTLDLTADFGYQSYLNSHEPGWQTMLTLTIPLMNFKQHANYRIQLAEESLAQVNAEKVKRELTAQQRRLQTNLQRAVESAIQREQSRLMAQSLYQDNQKRLRAGRSSMNDILVDQNRLAQAELLAISGWAQAHTLLAEQCHSLGQLVKNCLNNLTKVVPLQK